MPFRNFLVLAGLVAGMIWLEPISALPAARNEQDQRAYADRLGAARVAYFKVILSNDQGADARAHEALAALERDYPGDPVAKAYHGSLELLDAAHNWAVWNLHKQASEGLALLDQAVTEAPDEPEARFIRAATSWHLPGFYRRKAQCEADFGWLSERAETDARDGRLPPELAAAAYNYWGADPGGAERFARGAGGVWDSGAGGGAEPGRDGCG